MAWAEIWSFFTGAMGLDLGFEQAGIQPTFAVELDDWCCKTIRLNRPTVDLIQADISRVAAGDLLRHRGRPAEVFLMVGGPPCQSFCPGGRRAALSDPRGNLIYSYLKLVGEIRPHYFVLENVGNLVTAALRHRPIAARPGRHWNLKSYDHKRSRTSASEAPMEADELSGSAIRQVFADMSALGYHLNFAVLDAADYGAPQHRYRFIMLGSRDGNAPAMPPPTHGERSRHRLAWRTVRDAIYDLRLDPGPHSEYTPAMRRFFELVPPGGTWRDLPAELHREALGGAFDSGGGKTGFYRRLSWDDPAPTITGRSNRKASAVCHPDFTRPLSVRESARIQGFPDAWHFTGAMNRQYVQVGNAVPVALGRAIADAISAGAGGARSSEQNHFDLEVALMRAVQRLRATARNKRTKNLEPAPTLFG